MTLRPSPVVALNRAIAVAQNEGPERGLEEIRSLTDHCRLTSYPFYHAAFGELELRRGSVIVADHGDQDFLAAISGRDNAIKISVDDLDMLRRYVFTGEPALPMRSNEG